MPEDEWYPSWGMIGLAVSVLALFIAMMSAKKQTEMAETCVLKPKEK